MRMDLRENRVEKCGLDTYSSEEGPVTASCEHHKEPSGSGKGGKFAD